jgi:adenylate cyclase
VGVLLVESEIELQAFTYDDEDALALLSGQLAQLMAALQVAEVAAGAPARLPATPEASRPAPAPREVSDPPAQASGPAALTLRHWARDHTVFAGDDYLIKGVAGAILWRLATEQQQRGRSEFTTRELRLAGGDLGLPDVQDNLGVRLILLERRLAERDCGLSIERAGRGRFRFVAARPIVLQEEAGG